MSDHESSEHEMSEHEIPTLSEALAESRQNKLDADVRTCTNCNETCPPEANWCEACGTDLDPADAVPKRPCISCSAPAIEVTDDGWCQMCGTKQPAPEDHVVVDHGWFAMVCDKGRVHRTNEDAGAVGPRARGVALVVCDGVSSTDQAQHASRNAVAAIITVVENAPPAVIDDAIVEAASAAQTEIVAVTAPDATEPPSCTMVTVVADINGDEANIRYGWLGDSRAYWLAGGIATQLTRDHSWAVEQYELGQLAPEVIDADRRAHSITRWLGADSHDITPELASLKVELPGVLLVCSDGLWNYAPTEVEIHDLVHAGEADESVVEQAERLVESANAQGGHDNITVALAHLKPHSTTEEPDNPAANPTPGSPKPDPSNQE